MFRSLRWRLALSHALVLSVILLVAGFAVQLLLERRLDDGVTRELQDAAQAEVEQLGESLQLQRLPDSEIPSHAAVRIAIYDTAGHLVGDAAEAPAWLVPQREPISDVKASGETVRLVTVSLSPMGFDGAFVVAGRSLNPEQGLLAHMRALMLVGAGAAIGFSVLAGWWLAGLAVRPVRRAYEAQASFAADASHELRTPLAFVRSGVEVMAEGEPELGGQVLEEIDYITALTGRLLQLARSEQGADLATAPVDLATLCGSAARRSRVAHGNRLALTGPDGLAALADLTSLEAVLDALLENVATHGGGSADISWGPDGNGHVAITVADHGPGIPDDVDPERVFDRFYRADASRARATGGVGLGMPLARTHVEAQGGRISLERAPEGGLTARIQLRAAT